MESIETIIQFLSDSKYIPQSANKIADKLKMKGERRLELFAGIEILLKKGIIVKSRKKEICIPTGVDLITGIMHFRQNGNAILVPTRDSDNAAINILAEDTGVAMHRDLVLVRKKLTKSRKLQNFKNNKSHSERDGSCQVIRVLDRRNKSITGTLKNSSLNYFIIPDDPRISSDIFVHDPRNSGIKPTPKINDKVVVRLDVWKHRHLNPNGKIIEVLGESHKPIAEHKAILRFHNLNPEFPPEVLRDAEKIPDVVLPDQRKDRLDMRKITTITIDPEDAKDFDDALSLESFSNNETRVGIHIADVNAYVKQKSQIDKEAQIRGNSTYLVGEVIPMLPPTLSNGICSLVEGKDRLTKSVFLTFSSNGKLCKTEFANTVICSNKRLTYQQAFALLKEDQLNVIRKIPLPPPHQTGSTGRPLSDLSNFELKIIRLSVRKLWKIAKVLRAERFKHGSLDLNIPEVKIYVDRDGYADSIESLEYDESHQLIEEFMLTANEAVAKSLRGYRIPLIYRVHDKPDPKKLEELQETLASYGLKTGNLINRKEMVTLIAKLNEHPQGHTLRIQFLRSLKQACYRADPDGHFGLNMSDYTHFTSPIRRYSDLTVHRILDSFITNQKKETLQKKNLLNYSKQNLTKLSQHLSLTEQNSNEAERSSVKVKLLEFFDRELKKNNKSVFDAVIVDLKTHGIFVELIPSMAFGFVHVSTLRNDHYILTPNGNALIGRRGRKKFLLGQKVKVRVNRINRFKRQIDFHII